jgi:hypothetical protein
MLHVLGLNDVIATIFHVIAVGAGLAPVCELHGSKHDRRREQALLPRHFAIMLSMKYRCNNVMTNYESQNRALHHAIRNS